MGGRHRTGRSSRRAGWFVAGTCAGVIALGASLTAVVGGRQPPDAVPGTDPEAGVSLRTYPVPRPTASGADVARNLRNVDTAAPTTSRPTYTPPPAVTHTSQPSVTRPGRRRHGRPRRTPVCYVFRYHGHTYRYCASHPPHR